MKRKYVGKQIKEFYPGFIGGEEVAKLATNKEAEALAKLVDKHVYHYNRALTYHTYFLNIVEAIKKRSKEGPD